MLEKKFTVTHEWISLDEQQATVGITNHAQELLGDLVFVELPKIGRIVNKGEELGVVESVKAAADFYAPMSGTVVAVNNQVEADPALVNQQPLADGWLIKMKINDLSELESLLNEADYLSTFTES